jgi:hypothetical protein
MFWKKNKKNDVFEVNMNEIPPPTSLDTSDLGFDIPKIASDKQISDDVTIPAPEEFGMDIKAENFQNQPPILPAEKTQPQKKNGSRFKKIFGKKREKIKSPEENTVFSQIPAPSDFNITPEMNDANLSSLNSPEERSLDSINIISAAQNTGIAGIKEEKSSAETSSAGILENEEKDNISEDVTKNPETAVKKSVLRPNGDEKLKQKTDAILKELVLYRKEIEDASKTIAGLEKVLKPVKRKAKAGVKHKKVKKHAAKKIRKTNIKRKKPGKK